MKDTGLLQEIRARYDEGWSADIKNREEMESDLRFVAGEQWPEDVRREREGDERPCITENMLTQFVRQVANDMRANPPAVKVIAGTDGAEKAVADILTGMVRDIEARSATKRPYVTAGASAARCGIGHWRVLTDYTSPTSFEQEILIEPIPNPFAVIWDPTSILPTREDANWCFVVEDLSEDEFERQYPDAQPVSFENKDSEVWSSAWLNTSRKTVRVAEYWRKIKKPAKAVKLQNGATGFKEDLPKEMWPMIVEERETDRCTVEVVKTNGLEIIEKAQVWPTRHIPIVPVVGEEYSVGEHRVRHSVIRFAKDSQTIHNYWLSTQTEHLALQPKAPFVATAKQVQNYADVWKTANKTNHSVLIYDVDPNAPGSRPMREQPPASSSAFSEQIARAEQGMKATTGIYAAGLGDQGNETSGKAIMARQREGDIGTFEFRDNLNASVEHTGRILIDLIPIIYDTPRMVRILGEDGEEDFAEINKPTMDPMTGEQKVENNLKLGQYGVQVRSGPSYTTRRQEAAESMLAFVGTMPDAASIVMDLVAKNMDWPGADEFAERFKKGLPPQFQPETDDPEEQQQRQMAQQQAQEVEQVNKRGIMAEIATKEATAQKTQAEAQKVMIDIQSEPQRLQMEMQREQFMAQQEAEARMAENQLKMAELRVKEQELAVKQQELALKAREIELKHEEVVMNAQLQRETAMQAQQQAEMQAKAPEAKPEAAPTQDRSSDALGMGLQALAQAMSKPRTVVRDNAGKLVGVE
jgi:Phage P22-like portal protein